MAWGTSSWKLPRTFGILKDLFGCPHEVTRLLLDELFEGTKTSRLNADALPGLALRMESYKIAIAQMD